MTQASVTDAQRDAFEKWATSEFGYNTRRSLSDKDGYHYLSTQRAWEGWSAALSTQPKAVIVERLKPIIAGIAFINNPTGQRILEDLTAIIGEGD